MKKKILFIALIAICISLAAGGTAAYFTAEDTARNVITSDGMDIELVEWQETPNGLIPYPDQPIDVMPGGTVSKIVSVTNLDAAAWVRARYSVIMLDANGKQMQLSDEELSKLVIIEPDAENWTQKDGWWYYTDAVATDQQTEPFFTQVRFAGAEMGNEYQRCKVIVDVTAQAVQHVNNGGTVLDAAGWPESD